MNKFIKIITYLPISENMKTRLLLQGTTASVDFFLVMLNVTATNNILDADIQKTIGFSPEDPVIEGVIDPKIMILFSDMLRMLMVL